MFQPEKKLKPAPSPTQAIKSIILSSWLNLLLVCIPVSWGLHFAKQDDTIVFVFSFLAIIPLAKLLAFATDELSMRVGQTLAGLLNATLVSSFPTIIALLQCQLHIVQSSLVGSILSNLLLVLGMCFFAGGTRFAEQGFGQSASQLNASLLTVSVIAVLLPGAYHMAVSDTSNTQNPGEPSNSSDLQEGTQILRVSHGVAIILLFIYGSYLVFQLFSHKDLYDDANPDVSKSTQYAPHRTPKQWKHDRSEMKAIKKRQKEDPSYVPEPEEHATEDVENGPLAPEDEEPEQPKMGVYMTIGLLVVITVFVAITAEFLVDSIDGLTETGAISKEFVGLILLPIVGNAAEHVTAVTVSVKDKLTLSLGVAVGSSIQIALFVIPFIVTLAWIIGKPLTLLFDPLESVVLFLAVLTVNYTVQDGKSNWLEGMILMCLYLIVAVVFWYYPGSDPSIALEVGAACYGLSAAQ
ncbi:calcium/proton exchanger [Athelia psychrophila]|uniref:Calcium/proton exchanger n=1 Tax=Athelia psychrophila TaxID=1759441 RepID=A0A166UIL7_9AGAM|nr:calcium/proton exchanger [Fibularhizoctonia sp. CBS 109695]